MKHPCAKAEYATVQRQSTEFALVIEEPDGKVPPLAPFLTLPAEDEGAKNGTASVTSVLQQVIW